jgi:hypothetical protein
LNLIRVMPAKGQDKSMQPSHTIARLVGPVFAILGIGVLVNIATYRSVTAELLNSNALILLSGVLVLTAGLAILNAHPLWTHDWRSLITAIGWLLAVIGAFRIFAPQYATFVRATTGQGFLIGAGIVLLALGGFITFKGYAA